RPEHVVAGDDADPEADLLFASKDGDQLGCGWRIAGAEIADDGDLVLDAVLENRRQQRLQLGLIAEVGILAAAQLRQRQSPFAERLEDNGGAFARRLEV